MTVVAALGDSFTCGEGVGVRVAPDATWVAVLTGALPDGRLVRLADPGARIADVRARQLPRLPDRVDVATLLVGLNDVARAGFRAGEVASDLRSLIGDLRRRADVVVVGRLHDPTTLLPVPARVAEAARRRLVLVNSAVDAVAGWPGVRVLDLGTVPGLGHRCGWAVDRIHPSEAGHRAIAAAAIGVIRGSGPSVPAPTPLPGSGPGPSWRASTWWAVRHGLPYAAAHLRDIAGPAASAVLTRG